MATYEELIQAGYNRPQALRILKDGDAKDLQEQITALTDRVAQLEAEVDGNAF